MAGKKKCRTSGRVNGGPIWAALSVCVALQLAAPDGRGLVGALDNGLALTPPMGWLAWERYVCELDCAQYPGECIDERLFRDMADRLVEDGFKQVGYEYVNIDDCWSTRARDPLTGRLVADPSRFAGGSVRQLADYVHARGLKLGIYGDCGTDTCQKFPGQLRFADNLTDNHYEVDARTFAEWTIDSFKFDGCYMNVSRAHELCPPMGAALNRTQRPMLFSCSWPAYENDERLATNWSLVVERCNLWRAFGDIEDSWRSVLDTVDYFVRMQDLVVQYHGPGHWFDADQLVIGDFGLSHEQERAHMAVWCIWASPLYMSNDLRSLSKESARVLRNKWAIAVNQDPMGIFGMMVAERAQVQAFVKPVRPLHADGCPSYAVVLLDRRTLGNGRLASFPLAQLVGGIHSKLARVPRWADEWAHCGPDRRAGARFHAHDLFDGFQVVAKNLSLSGDSLRLRANPNGARMVQLIAVQS